VTPVQAPGELVDVRPASREGTADADRDSRRWLVRLHPDAPDREAAIAELHALMRSAASFEVRRRAATLRHLRGEELEDIAAQAADDALVALLRKLAEFRGASRFTTWAYKFAIYQTSVALRRRAWRDREVLLEPRSWSFLPDRSEQPAEHAEVAEVLAAVREGIAGLSPHQRHVLVALTVNDVPIDVLAERLGTTRGALYKTLHDARRRLRAHLAERGLLTTATAPVEETR